ncbi:hypothetical protein IFR09_06065 [Pseudomonas syringae]|nr:hypothetical protein [Pseudomonas syringae]MBD8789296.1 hypothetical protein [Pseudomonas syringae]MBD8800260.1 hypothetical protein [Pseudomonas syringae]MBD8810724.1 hypothetical protein [Pseudomonas syringae]
MKWNSVVSAVLSLLLSAIACAQEGHERQHSKTMLGRLTVHSSIDGETSSPLIANLRGHSWLSYESLEGHERWTAGTWNGGIPVRSRTSRKGLNFNLEMGWHPNIYRTTLIDRLQYDRLMASVKAFDTWRYDQNCSYFASTVWNDVTGESLSNWTENQDSELKGLLFGDLGGRRIPLPSPSGLFDSIFISNGHWYNNDDNRLRRQYERIHPPTPMSPQDLGFGLGREEASSSLGW